MTQKAVLRWPCQLNGRNRRPVRPPASTGAPRSLHRVSVISGSRAPSSSSVQPCGSCVRNGSFRIMRTVQQDLAGSLAKGALSRKPQTTLVAQIGAFRESRHAIEFVFLCCLQCGLFHSVKGGFVCPFSARMDTSLSPAGHPIAY